MVIGITKDVWKNQRSIIQEVNSARVMEVHMMLQEEMDGLMISFQSAKNYDSQHCDYILIHYL